MSNMSPIEKIHSKGLIAVIDGDRQVIVKSIKPEQKDFEIFLLTANAKEAEVDSDGDIVFYEEQ